MLGVVHNDDRRLVTQYGRDVLQEDSEPLHTHPTPRDLVIHNAQPPARPSSPVRSQFSITDQAVVLGSDDVVIAVAIRLDDTLPVHHTHTQPAVAHKLVTFYDITTVSLNYFL